MSPGNGGERIGRRDALKRCLCASGLLATTGCLGSGEDGDDVADGGQTTSVVPTTRTTTPTPEPTPTPTEEPTPTATPTPEYSCQTVVDEQVEREAGETREFELRLAKGDKLRITATTVSGEYPVLTLIGPDGGSLIDGVSENPIRESVTADTTGSYIVSLENAAVFGSGEWKIEITHCRRDGGSTTTRTTQLPETEVCRTVVSEQITVEGGGSKEYEQRLQEGEEIVVQVRTVEGNQDAILKLFDPDGEKLAEANEASMAESARATTAGTYTVTLTNGALLAGQKATWEVEIQVCSGGG